MMVRAGVFIVAIALLFSLPATAQLGRLWSDFRLYAEDLQNYLQDNLGQTLQSVESEADIAIETDEKVLNIPNPLGINQAINNEIIVNSLTDEFENNSLIYAQDINNEIYRFITRGRVAAFLEPNSQIRLRNKLRSTENAIKTIAESTRDANNNYSDFLNDIPGNLTGTSALNQLTSLLGRTQSRFQLQSVRIQGEQAQFVGELLGQTIEMRQSLQYSNLNLASISQQMEQVNRARRVDSSAEAARLLRNTSQTDLLGRSEE
ncbi:MAG: hypothetical protein QNJ51_24750 [Calothrix sp. MO_167.B12]|nr:hypothetical protein [Calothrix sp. MO_167.B12]